MTGLLSHNDRPIAAACVTVAACMAALWGWHTWQKTRQKEESSSNSFSREHEGDEPALEMAALHQALACEQASRLAAEAQAKELLHRLQALASKTAPPSSNPSSSNPSSSTPSSSTTPAVTNPQPSVPTAPLMHFRPIGYLKSCFTTRNGTPRQPLLVSSARSRLTLLPDVPDASLEGLTAWSHVWVLYWFHENTESRTKVPVGDLHGVKGKVKVPRLNGEKVGLFATRTPHRPVPIGLSVAQIIAVEGRIITLGGADIVDGSPILDIKPYVPFCDSVPRAIAPSYVQAEADEEPLAISNVIVTPVGREQLTLCWRQNTRTNRTLYPSAEEYIAFVSEVLSRDIRSTRQRLHVGQAAQQRNTASLASAEAVAAQLKLAEQGILDETQSGITQQSQTALAPASGSAAVVHSVMNTAGSVSSQIPGTGVFHVVLEGVDVSYDIDRQGTVVVGGGSLRTALAAQHAHKHRASQYVGS